MSPQENVAAQQRLAAILGLIAIILDVAVKIGTLLVGVR